MSKELTDDKRDLRLWKCPCGYLMTDEQRGQFIGDIRCPRCNRSVLGFQRVVLREEPAGEPPGFRRLVNFLCDSDGMTAAEVRADLEADGVDVDAFLARVHATIEKMKEDA